MADPDSLAATTVTPTTEEILAQPHQLDTLADDQILGEREGMYFDREGREVAFWQWAKLHDCQEYVRVAQETIGNYWVSTVWLGLDHGHGRGLPLIFESMVFAAEPTWHEGFEFQGVEHPGYWAKEDFDQRRYPSLELALAGHAELVEEVRLFAGLDG